LPPGCTETYCSLFDEAVVEGRGLLAALEVRADGTSGYHFDGAKPSHVQWSLVDTLEVGHGTVIEVIFNANDPDNLINDNGWFAIVADRIESITVDLSEFAEGALTFDMRIVQNGTIVDGLEVRMDCVWPCGSEELWVADPPALNNWQTYSFPMQRLIATGLDITKVNNLFSFKPMWGSQIGQYIIHLDNIRLTKEYASEVIVPPEPLESLSKIYYQNGNAEGSAFGVTNNADGTAVTVSEVTEGDATYIDLLYNTDTPSPQFYIYPTSGLKYEMTEYFHGEMVFDLRVVSYGENEGVIRVNSFCGWPCRSYPHYSIDRPEEGTWQTFRVPVRELAENGLDLSRIFNGLFLQFHATTSQGLHLQFNNIRWEYLKAE
jgi:hypothetical protein